MKERVQQLVRYHQIKRFIKANERLLLPGFLLVGFVGDVITFRTLNIRTAFILLTIHLILAGSAIFYINVYDSKLVHLKSKLKGYLRLAAPFVMQFSFGALLSATFIFYWFSGAFAVSWPFVLLILGLMVANEVFKDYYLKPVAQLGIYYLVLFSFLSLVLPFVFTSISAWVFITSGGLSILLTICYWLLITKLVPSVEHEKKRVITVVGIIFILMNLFYFAGVTPPVPLAIRDAGVYHSVARTGGGLYRIEQEKTSIFEKLIPGKTLEIAPGERLYVFTSIFAPEDLDLRVFHQWQYYDKDQGKWIDRDRLSYALTGGREDGFRGYTLKTSIPEGKWRVDVETERGQVIGRVRFTVKQVTEPVEKKDIFK